VAINIVVTGVGIIRQSIAGLMDSAWSANELEQLDKVLEPFLTEGVKIHAIRTRLAGARRFVSFHVLVPGHWTVDEGHHLLEQIEEAITRAIPNANVTTHLEPINDPASWNDVDLDRDDGRGVETDKPQ
jgi:divalent metal cation (Fe/Co/Zn/Cd) transporter